MDYLRDPAEILERSFRIVRAETDLSSLPSDMAEVAVRLVHACGMPDIVADLRWSNGAAARARSALAAGAPVICDSRMVAAGISRARGDVLCMLGLPNVGAMASDRGTTRSAAQVELWKPFLPGSVVAVGNAPTALFRLLEVIAEDPGREPAAVLAFPVGFVGAAESKQALVDHGVSCITVLGRRGGSAMAAAAVNALAG